MFGWASRIPRLASRRSRAIAFVSCESAADSTLIAYRSRVATSLARYTNDIPPSPTFFTISYRPCRVWPTRFVWAIGAATPRVGAAVDRGVVAIVGDAVGPSRRVPSRVQKRASSGYTVPQLGQRFIRFGPGYGRRTSRD